MPNIKQITLSEYTRTTPGELVEVLLAVKTEHSKYLITADKEDLINLKKEIEKVIKNGNWWKKDERYCHLCGAKEIKGGWCTNKSCAEYRKYEEPEVLPPEDPGI